MLRDKSNAPIAYCTVKLLQEEKVVEATLSKQDGSFSLQAAAGTYTLRSVLSSTKGFLKYFPYNQILPWGGSPLLKKCKNSQVSLSLVPKALSPIPIQEW